MKVSTRVMYGMRLMFQLALHEGRGYMYLKDIAAREDISEKYLSQIVIPLRGSGLVTSSRGAHGGYRLAQPPARITARAVVEALDSDLRAARWQQRKETDGSVTNLVWEAMFGKMIEALEGITLKTLLDTHRARTASAVEYNI